MNSNKITVYDSTWLPKIVIGEELIWSDIAFSETINTWQWQISLKIKDSFDSSFYTKWDIVELIVFNDTYKNWLHRYSWQVSWLKRQLASDWEFIELVINGIFYFLNDLSITKTYSWSLIDVIDEFIVDIWVNNNLSNETDILWLTLLKNWIISINTVNVDVDWNMLSALVDIFENAWIDFFIKSDWSIIETAWDDLIITARSEWVEIYIDESLETEIIISNQLLQDFYPTKTIVLQNVPDSVNLEWEVIKWITYNDTNTTLLLWTLLRFDY